MSTTEELRPDAIRALNRQNVSTGEKLLELAVGVLLEVDEIDLEEPYAEDRCAEIADSAVPVYTSEIMETISEDVGLMAQEPELGPAFDGSPTPSNIAAANLYELASNIAHERLRERQQEAE
jgi:hypothetical protein